MVGGWVVQPNQNSKRQMEKSLVLISLQRTQKKEKKSEKLKLKQSEKNAPNNAHTHTERHTL